MGRNSPSARMHRALVFLARLEQYKRLGPLVGPKEVHQPDWQWVQGASTQRCPNCDHPLNLHGQDGCSFTLAEHPLLECFCKWTGRPLRSSPAPQTPRTEQPTVTVPQSAPVHQAAPEAPH